MLTISCLAIIILFTLGGIIKGLVRSLISMFGVVFAIIISTNFSGFATDLVYSAAPSSNPYAIGIMTYVIVFLLVYFAIFFLAPFSDVLASRLHLVWSNRVSGGIVGFVLGLFFASVIVNGVLILTDKSSPYHQSVMNSFLLSNIGKVAHSFSGLALEEQTSAISNKINEEVNKVKQ